MACGKVKMKNDNGQYLLNKNDNDTSIKFD
jgi:hypothetical protein